MVKTGDKRYFVDFGRTVVGGVQLKLSGTGGEPVEIRVGEELTSPNVVDYTMRTGNTYRDVWTLRPGTQTLNLWGYRVFRYAEVIGADPEEIKATALVVPVRPGRLLVVLVERRRSTASSTSTAKACASSTSTCTWTRRPASAPRTRATTSSTCSSRATRTATGPSRSTRCSGSR